VFLSNLSHVKSFITQYLLKYWSVFYRYFPLVPHTKYLSK